MKIKDLIKHLQTMDPEFEVVRQGYRPAVKKDIEVVDKSNSFFEELQRRVQTRNNTKKTFLGFVMLWWC